MSAALFLHKDVNGNDLPHKVDVIATSVLWLHGVSALLWVACVGVVVLVALPAGRRLLTPAALRYFEVRLENVIRLSGLFTVVLVVTGIYNLKKNTPYPTPWLSASPSEVLELPDATPYFLVLAGKIVIYGLMLAAAAYLIGQARAYAAQPGVDDEPVGGSGGVATLAPTRPLLVSSQGTRVALGVFVAAGLAVLLSLSWLRTLHLVIEGKPSEAELIGGAHGSGVPEPIFTKVEVKPDGAGAWWVSLTLSDHATQLPPPSVFVTITGTGPNGEKVGPVDFAETTAGVYRGRIAGAAGTWSLLAVTESKPGGLEVAPTRQSFSVPLAPPAAAK